MRASPTATPDTLKAHATAYLKGFGLAPHAVPEGKADTAALDLLRTVFDQKELEYSGRHGDTTADPNADLDEPPSPADYLSPVEAAAWQLVYANRYDTLTDLKATYIVESGKSDDAQFLKHTELAFDALIAVVGDVRVDSFTRQDAHTFVQARRDEGNRTTTVRRRINSLNAAWTAYLRAKSLTTANPWEGLRINAEGKDSTARVPFTADELERLYSACRAADDDRRWLLAMLIDTGARLAEVAGLHLSDIRLDAPVPHVLFQPHPGRSLKTSNSKRAVPLSG